MKMKKIIIASATLLSFLACNSSKDTPTDATKNPTPISENITLTQETVFSDRGIIWGFEFLPDSDIIFSEKSGKVGIYSNGKVTELSGLPTDINTDSQGGLLDICLHPDYATNGWIYASYSSEVSGKGVLNLIRFKIEGNSIKNTENLFKSSATNQWKGHYGSRIVFDKNGFLFLSIGEGGSTTYGGENSPNLNAQNVKEAWGKVHRMTDTGKVPTDNPILTGNSAPTTVYSYGHRNPQGLVLNTDTGEIWETEHGPKGGDELNLIQKGKNYGWPLVSWGVNYDGNKISDSHNRTGVENPKHYWTPSIGACGLAFVSSTKYGSWKGSYIAGGLALRNLSRVEVNGSDIKSRTIIESAGRVRDVKMGPDGYLYLSVESPGRIVRLLPK
jgi:aldose sugar dehydrogenase